MILSFHPCFDTDVQIILADRPVNSSHHNLIRKAEAIILPQGCPVQLFRACSSSRAFVFPNYETRFKYPGKIGQSLLFRDFGYPHPETLSWSSVKEFKEKHSDNRRLPHTLPFLVKEDKSHEAEGVHFVEDRLTLFDALAHLSDLEKSGISGFVTQAYIPSGGNVLRVVIIGKRVFSYWKRPSKAGELITTISRGALIDHRWRPDLQEEGIRQTLALCGQTGINLAAIDLVFPLTLEGPGPLLLEINYFFARRGLGGIQNYYQLLYQAIQEWLSEKGLNPKSLSLM